MFINVEPVYDKKFETAKSLIYKELSNNKASKITNKGLILQNIEDEDDNFHKSISTLLKIGEFFGLLPVSGISYKDHTRLRIDPKSPKFIWFCLTTIGSAALAGFSFFHMMHEGLNLGNANTLIFFTNSLLVVVFFFKLSRIWPKLSSNMAKRENIFKRDKILRKHSLKTKLKWACYVILLLSFLEHILAISNGVCNAIDCFRGHSLFETFYEKTFPNVFYFTHFSAWKALFLQIVILESTFHWNFLDLFIIEMSIALTYRFHILNDYLYSSVKKFGFVSFWKSIREEYCHLVHLVKQVDKELNQLIMLSFASDLYFICVQLYHSLTPKAIPDCEIHSFSKVIHVIYFVYSFSYLMGRSFSVWMVAAHLHTVSKRPTDILYEIPSSQYNEEIHRLLEQVTYDTVALTGMRFFNITRGLILTIAGTVITYELVLIQFNVQEKPSNANATSAALMDVKICDIRP